MNLQNRHRHWLMSRPDSREHRFGLRAALSAVRSGGTPDLDCRRDACLLLEA